MRLTRPLVLAASFAACGGPKGADAPERPIVTPCETIFQPSIDELVWDLVAPRGVDPRDAKPGLDRALVEAKAHLQARPEDSLVLYFPAGTYTFEHPSGAAISLVDLRAGRLTFRGAGAAQTKLVFAQFDQRGFDIQTSDRVTIEAMELSRPALYTTQGDVTEVSRGRVQLRVHAGFPDPIPLMRAPLAQANERTLVRFRGDPLDPELAPNSQKIALADMVDRGGGLYDAILEDADELPDVAVGDQVALKSKVGDKTVFAKDADDFTMRDVTITRRSAVPIAVDGASDRTLLTRITIPRDPPIQGRAPFFSGQGGGPQLTAEAHGPTIEDSTIVGTTDDAIALDAADMGALPSGACIRRNVIRDSQGRGVNVSQSRGGLVADNVITRTVNASIQLRVTQKANGHEDAAVTGWRIRGNTLVEAWSDGVIWLNKENQAEDVGLHDDIDVEANVFVRAPKNNPMIHVENTSRLRVNDNRVESFSLEEDVPVGGVPQPAPLVFVDGGLDVSGAGNTALERAARPITSVTRGSVANVQWSVGGQ